MIPEEHQQELTRLDRRRRLGFFRRIDAFTGQHPDWLPIGIRAAAVNERELKTIDVGTTPLSQVFGPLSRFFVCFVGLLLCSCATEIFEDGQLVCRVQSDATGVEFRTPKGTHFSAATINNSAPTAAATNGATQLAAGIAAGIATNRLVK